MPFDLAKRTRQSLGAAAVILIGCGALSCWDTSNPLRACSGATGSLFGTPHVVNLGGVLHASGYCAPYPKCAQCHGDSLQGARGVASCTSCHTAHWELSSCGTVTHTVNLGGTLHAPGYCQPYTNCVACHGLQLQGGRNGEPSCTSCHDQRWRDCGD
jgi:hypothetical protein